MEMIFLEMKLKAKRVEKGMTQAEVAEALGIATPTYIHKENGNTLFNLNEIKQLITLFNCSFEDIFLL
jgi:DNA-binding XRE family transcriptional regulator